MAPGDQPKAQLKGALRFRISGSVSPTPIAEATLTTPPRNVTWRDADGGDLSSTREFYNARMLRPMTCQDYFCCYLFIGEDDDDFY